MATGLAKLNLDLGRFALESVLWLRQTRHLVSKPSPAPPPDTPIREVAWAHPLRCSWMGDRQSAGQSGRSVLCRAEQKPGQARLLGAVKFLLTLSTRSKRTLARHCGRGVARELSRGVRLFVATDTGTPPPSPCPFCAKSLTFILSPVQGPSCRHANLVRVLATQRPIRNL
ncbi:hypothetical protein TgHK011_000303 [Trichoderma gracile]|nr:hypothetical protein TgHK011_000303 [Trichoderma gracile]